MATTTILTDIKIYVLLFGLFFLIVSAFIFFFYSKRYNLARESDSWPKVQGVITKSEIKNVLVGRTQFKPLVEYTYTVNGSDYSSNWINIGNLFKDRKGKNEAIEIVNKFSSNSNVSIYYDSNNPIRSVLIPGLLPIHSTLKTISIVMILADFFLLALVLTMFALGI